MRERHFWRGSAAITFAVAVTFACALSPSPSDAATTARPAGSLVWSAGLRLLSPRVQCVALAHDRDKLAVRLAHDIDARLSGRASTVGLEMRDGRTGITCRYHAAAHFIAASAIKVTIAAALLLKAQEAHRGLTAREKGLAWRMITRSDNDAATALWDEVRIGGMQHFLDLAKMRQTRLDRAWGLTLLTAHDETLLLTLISQRNKILAQASRVYVRYLMGHVISAQRWGVPAGAPRRVGVHVKNGWLPYPGDVPWEINSLGIFTSAHRVYVMTFLTYGNPSMAYGVQTIERAAEVMHHDLNPGAHQVTPPSSPNSTWGTPDELIPRSDG